MGLLEEGLQRVVTGRQCLARELGSKLLPVSLLAPLRLPFGLVSLSVTKAVSVGHVRKENGHQVQNMDLSAWL